MFTTSKKFKAPLYNEQIELQLSHVRARIMQSQCTRNVFLYHCTHVLDVIEIKYPSSLFMSTGISWYFKYWTSKKYIPANTNSLSMTSIYSMEYTSTQKHHTPPKLGIDLASVTSAITNRLCLHNTMTQITLLFQLLQQDVKCWLNETNICTENIHRNHINTVLLKCII